MPLSIPAELLQNAGLSSSFIAHFCLFFSILLSWTLVCGALFNRLFRLPTIAGHIISGILLGPSLINIAHFPLFAEPITMLDTTTNTIYSLLASDLHLFCILLISSAFTVSFLLWMAGHETDLKDIAQVGGIAVLAGTLGALLPILIIGGVLYYCLPYYTFTTLEATGLGLIFSATSVSIPVAMLYAGHKMHLKSSKATLGAAIVDDIVAVILLSFFFLAAQSGFFADCMRENSPLLLCGHNKTILESLGYLMLSLVILIGIGYYIVRPGIQRLATYQQPSLMAPIATSIMFLYFSFAELFGGLAGITGAYFAGLFHRMGDTQHHAATIIVPFVNTILLPIFLGSIGLQVNIRLLHVFDWILVLILLSLAIISKLAACFISTTLSNALTSSASQNRWTALESYLFGSAMIARGEVGLVIATILHGSHIITADKYVIAIVVILLTTIATPIMLALGFSRLDTVESTPPTP